MTFLYLVFLLGGICIVILILKSLKITSTIGEKFIKIIFLLFPSFFIYLGGIMLYQTWLYEDKIKISEHITYIFKECDVNDDKVLDLRSFYENGQRGRYTQKNWRWHNHVLNRADSNKDSLCTYNELLNEMKKYDYNKDDYFQKKQTGIDEFDKKQYINEYEDFYAGSLNFSVNKNLK